MNRILCEFVFAETNKSEYDYFTQAFLLKPTKEEKKIIIKKHD